MYRSEDEYWNAYYEARDRAEDQALEYAEMSAELVEFDSDAEREAYIMNERDRQYERLFAAYEKAL